MFCSLYSHTQWKGFGANPITMYKKEEHVVCWAQNSQLFSYSFYLQMLMSDDGEENCLTGQANSMQSLSIHSHQLTKLESSKRRRRRRRNWLLA
jgi:hypothetical protein